MQLATQAVAPDGQPLIEIHTIDRDTEGVHLTGTACVYEGNVLIWAIDVDGRTSVTHAQASRAGPERGEWQAILAVSPSVNKLVIGPEEMEESRNAELRRIELAL